MINEHEGHGFVKAEGSASIKSDDGITWGVLGFTSYNQELYKVLNEGLTRLPTNKRDTFKAEADSILGSMRLEHSKPTTFDEFERVLNQGMLPPAWGIRPNNQKPHPRDVLAAWGQRTLPQGKRTPWTNVATFFSWLGHQPAFIDVQWDRISRKYSFAVLNAKRALSGVDEPSLKAKMLMMDIGTFTGGMNSDFWAKLDLTPWGSESERLRQVADLRLQQLIAKNSPYVTDCRNRWNAILR